MRKIAIALFALLLAAPAFGQSAPATLPANTVYGRLGIPGDTGPGQAIPLATLRNSLGFPKVSVAGTIPIFKNAVGDLTSTPTFQLTPANPGNAAMYNALANPANGYIAVYNAMQVSLGDFFPASLQYGGNLTPIQQAIVGTVTIKAGDTGGIVGTPQGNGVAGYCSTKQGVPANCVALFGQSSAAVANASVFGADIIVENINRSGIGPTAYDLNYMALMEGNPNLWQVGGVNPTVTGNHFYGINIQGGGNHTNEIGSAIQINNSAFPATTRWATGIELFPGCCITGVSLGQIAIGNNQGSQQLSFLSKDAGGTVRTATFFADANGSLYANPAPSAAVIFEDGNGNVLGEFQSTGTIGGNTGFQLNQVAAIGVLKTSVTGVVSSSTTLPSGLSAPAFTVTGSFTATGLVTNAALVNPATTVNGQTCTLGSTCTVTATATSALTFGTHLTSGGASYNGSAPITITSDATNANTASTIVARDGSGNFTAGTITASLTGHASLDLAVSALGANVQTALGVAIGSAGAPVLFNGAGGTPSSIVLTNASGTAASLTAGDVANASVIAKLLTGYSAGAGTVASTDSILQGMQKLGGLVDNAAWTSYAPTVTGGAGSCGACSVAATGRSKQIGKTMIAETAIAITAIGSWSGSLIATLPATSATAPNAGICFESSVTGKSGASFTGGGSPTFQTRDAAAGSWWVNGYAITCTITYELS